MDSKSFIILIIGSFLVFLYDIFITNRISEREAKKAKYHCDKCKNWKCYHYYCERKRNELKEREKDV